MSTSHTLQRLSGRLDRILPRITDPILLTSQGIGNQIACYIFDYPAEHELRVREHLALMLKRLDSQHSELNILHLDLLDVVVSYLGQRGLLDKAIKMQATKSDAALLKALLGPLAAEKLRDFIADEYRPADADLFLLSGVGSVWPMLHAHSLLNCLHRVIGDTPLVMFFPGRFDGTALHLFGRIAGAASGPGTRPYYRAFTLISHEADA